MNVVEYFLMLMPLFYNGKLVSKNHGSGSSVGKYIRATSTEPYNYTIYEPVYVKNRVGVHCASFIRIHCPFPSVHQLVPQMLMI